MKAQPWLETPQRGHRHGSYSVPEQVAQYSASSSPCDIGFVNNSGYFANHYESNSDFPKVDRLLPRVIRDAQDGT